MINYSVDKRSSVAMPLVSSPASVSAQSGIIENLDPVQLFKHELKPLHKVLTPNLSAVKIEFEKKPHFTKKMILTLPKMVVSQNLLGKILNNDKLYPRPVFITASKVFVAMDNRKKGDILIGSGVFKKVYFAYCLTDGELYTFQSIKENEEKVMREFGISKATGCGPRIEGVARKESKKTFYYGNTKGCMVVELFHADLEKAISLDWIDLRDTKIALEVLKQASRELALFHIKQMVHRDVKLPNFLVKLDDRKGFTIKIADFGLSIRKPIVNNYDIVGTPLSIPPEVFRNEQQSEKVDAWGLAASIVSYHVTNKIPINLQSVGSSFDHFMYEFLDDRAQFATYFEFVDFMQDLDKISGDWIQKPDEKDTFEFVLWNLLKINPSERWSAGDAFRYLSRVAAAAAPAIPCSSSS